MKYRTIPAAELSPDLIEAWSRIQRAESTLNSPYFRPEFALAVASVRDTSEVAVFEDNGDPVGFLPFDRSKRNVAYPIAPSLTDFQGAIVQHDIEWDPEQMVRECGLRALYLDHQLASQRPLQPHHLHEMRSPYIDLSAGFDAYREKRSQMGGGALKKVLRKSRKLEREMGPVRLEMFSTNRDVFQTLIQWKTNQYVRTRAYNVLANEWTVRLLERLLDERSEALTGVMSALYSGDQLVSVRMGMMSFGVYHGWFPAYNVEQHQYSPGLVHLIRMAQDSKELGINRIDMGRGPEPYKSKFATGSTTVAEAAVDLRPLVRPLKRLWCCTENFVRSSRLYTPARFVVRNFRYLTRVAQIGVSK